MADGIRGHDYLDLPKDVIKGVLLHRAIDTFTDAHPIFRQSKHRLHENYGHYSGVVMDIFYDHFLAKNFSLYSNLSLQQYADNIYDLIKNNHNYLPEPAKRFYNYMTERNVLFHYSSLME